MHLVWYFLCVLGFTSKSFRVVHLDLKGAPPRLGYLRQLLPLLAAQGCDALLIEYEDMFPYTGRLANASALNAYTRKDVKRLLSWAHDMGMEVIPLVQTFGHLEYVLKLEEFRHYRELPSFPQEVCPSNEDTMSLIEEMIEQMMSLHPDAKYLHLGCDEVFHIAACSKCTQRHLSKIYARYVIQLAELVRKKYPGVTPIIWDDMMRQWSPQYISSSPLTSLIEPMVWVYAEDVSKLLPHYIWHWYGKTFKKVWIAGAYKGATLPTSVVPDIEVHFKNQISWLNYIDNTPVQIKGFVLTGWSRYDHFAVLCELLPVSIPSLFLGLSLISRKHKHITQTEVFNIWHSSMRCSPSLKFDLHNLKFEPRYLSSCNFPGIEIYNAILQYLTIKSNIEALDISLTEKKGWMTKYNVDHNYTSPWRILEDYRSLNAHQLQQELGHFKNSTELKLSKYFDQFSINEWIEQKIFPLEFKLHNLRKTMENLIRRDVWPRRPLR
ncbi:hypothetical protein AAG570_009382 [Ranatra chinensis]|uniref:beta-N-acetylhexosaminidase n=1 Tax=Ranatra chinensis TaxID=642074 RepID=A0ABD0YNX5_9HEMI